MLNTFSTQDILVPLTQTWKKLIFVRKLIFWIEKCPQIHIFPNHIIFAQITTFFHCIGYFLAKIDQLWTNIGDLWPLIG